jgi:polysaccharide pyruvyl transferase WcaK-like protein
MGWLGWTERETFETTMPAIELAYEGKIEMLRWQLGGPEQSNEPEPLGADVIRKAMRTMVGVAK